jgi:hypothetical protein
MERYVLTLRGFILYPFLIFLKLPPFLLIHFYFYCGIVSNPFEHYENEIKHDILSLMASTA